MSARSIVSARTIISDVERIASDVAPLAHGATRWSAHVHVAEADDGIYVIVTRHTGPSRAVHGSSYITGKELRIADYTRSKGMLVDMVVRAVDACVRNIRCSDLPIFRIATKPHPKRLVRRAA